MEENKLKTIEKRANLIIAQCDLIVDHTNKGILQWATQTAVIVQLIKIDAENILKEIEDGREETTTR